MAARTVMIQGTASHVGKSLITAALCRLFRRRGYRVAPFKAQNMSNNSCVTPDGKEIGRAQALQAAACSVAPRGDFNPVLIKPESELGAQLVVNGRVVGKLAAHEFGRVRRECSEPVREAFARLSAEFDLIVLEGAGSPAEVNLHDQDIANMWAAQMAKAPVLIVADIDRGGALASLVGTTALLPVDEQSMVKGFVINKFRGDRSLLSPGVRVVEERIGKPCVGVVPYLTDLGLPEEDSVGWKTGIGSKKTGPTLTIGVADLPYISNGTDLDALASEPDVRVVHVVKDSHEAFDALIFPGTKNTPAALGFVKQTGLDRLAHRIRQERGTIVGLCGGYQLLGKRLWDPQRIESDEVELEGLGLLDTETTFADEKRTIQVRGIHRDSGCAIEGYEIHMGRTTAGAGVSPLLEVQGAGERAPRSEGAMSADGQVLGTYVHGLFDAPRFRRTFLNRLRTNRGWPSLDAISGASLDQSLDRWADWVSRHVEMDAIMTIVETGL